MDLKKVLEIVYIPSFSTHAYICEGGEIYIQLQLGKCYTRNEFLNSESFKFLNVKSMQTRLSLFDELSKYYSNKYENNFIEELEQYINKKINAGFIASDYEPIKCECCNSIDYVDHIIDQVNSDITEKTRTCKKCGKIIGYWSYGFWMP